MKKILLFLMVLISMVIIVACNSIEESNENNVLVECLDEEGNIINLGNTDYSENTVDGVADYPAMIMVDGLLYYDSGEISNELRCGMMDGEITTVADDVPVEDNQSNFGIGYGYQYGIDTIEVCIDDEWHIFIPYESGKQDDWDSLSEQEKMEIDPTYNAE